MTAETGTAGGADEWSTACAWIDVDNDGDLDLFVALCRGEWQISGFQNRSLRRALPEKTGPQVSRLLKRLHVHGLIRKVGRTYKYYLTKFGQEVVLTALKLRELVVIPTLAGVLAG